MLDIFNIYETNEIFCASLYLSEINSKNDLSVFGGHIRRRVYSISSWERVTQRGPVQLKSIYEFHHTNWASFFERSES